MARAKERDLFTTIFTNGTLVPDHLDTLRRLDTVLMSLDGPAEIHDKMRGKGSHAKAMHALELMTSAGIKVWTNTVVTNKNTHVVDYILEQAGRFGTHAVFQPIFEHSYTIKGDEVHALSASRTEYLALVDELKQRKLAGAPVLNSASSLELLSAPETVREQAICLASRAYCAITPEGRVAPCQVLVQMEGLPDGKRIGFMEAFQRSVKPESCNNCSCFATIEGDLLFKLDPPTVANTINYLASEKIKTLSQSLGGSTRPTSRHQCDGGVTCGGCDNAATPSYKEPSVVAAPPPRDAAVKDVASVSKG